MYPERKRKRSVVVKSVVVTCYDEGCTDKAMLLSVMCAIELFIVNVVGSCQLCIVVVLLKK